MTEATPYSKIENTVLQLPPFSGRRVSEGFGALEKLGHLEWSLEALAVDKRFTALFSDDEANEALTRLMDAGYF